MSQRSALSEIEKSSDRTRSRNFLCNIWSNQKPEQQITQEEFQNDFVDTYDEQNVDENEFSNIEVTEHALSSEITSDYSADSQSKDHNLKSREVNEVVVPKSDDLKPTISGLDEPDGNYYDFSEMGAGLHNSDVQDDDDTSDYFDSEDEYFETYRKNFEDQRLMHGMVSSPYNSEGNGRYSRGIAQYYNMPVLMKSIQKYADSNGFEVHDVTADGNCLFRAIADQLSINGVFGNSPDSLRNFVLKYLRQNPLQEDGSHLEAFLYSETWEQYLSRMEKNTEWCDHMVLKASVDALGMKAVIYNVYETDVRRTEVLPGGHHGRAECLTIYLGHFGEFHYLSLRPKNWEREWQYKALLFRYYTCTKTMERDARKDFLQRKIDSMKALNIADKGAIRNLLGIESTDGENQTDRKRTLSHDLGYSICKTYGLSDLEPEESKDSQQCCIEDSFHIDSRTGIPLPHLFFMFRHLISRLLILTYSQYIPPITVDGTLFQYIGTYAMGTDVYLKDITRGKIMQSSNDKMKKDATVVAHTMEDLLSKMMADTASTHPGYLHVKVLSSGTEFPAKSLYRHAGQIYLKNLEVPQEMTLPQRTAECMVGFQCEFPSTMKEWRNRPRKFQWPPKEVIAEIQKLGCTVIPKHHPQSSHPEIEWKFNFSSSETILFSKAIYVSTARLHGFDTLKVLLESCSAGRLKHKHIKAVFFSCCEQIPADTWDTNFGGAILYSISYLLECLKRKNLPHYFIPSRNLLDCYTEEEIDDIYFQTEAARLFPLQTIQFLASKYGYSYGSKLEAIIFQNCRNFARNRNLVQDYREYFVPGTIRTVKFLARRGLYDAAFTLLRDTFETGFCSSRDEFCSLAEFFCSALGELRQKTSRIILAKMFENECGINLLNSIMRKECLFVKDILQWEVSFKIAWLDIPAEKTKNFELLAEFFYEFSKNELKRDNTDLASLGIAEAIHCLERSIQDSNMLDVTEIEDEDLNREILAQKSDIMKRLKEKLKDCFIHAYWISQLYRTFSPLQNYIPAIEELSKELPEMYGIVSIMFGFLRNHNKRKEYEELYDSYLGADTRVYRSNTKFH
ncbi:uncharacterized protein LOC125668458 isoform X2 [Ostrea edulis]|uniref:uncharacterized protein LOC125668458 isoform X2 n=1 Tax=Ostrea edulis TaxID=37623 RepID=UPI0024AFC74B|nr:uncharacterized protein LOC125668458 isoform X2 [Ostrea edulis]